MRTPPPAVPGYIPVRDYPAVARNMGITTTDRLTRTVIGTHEYYPLDELVKAAPGEFPLITAHRDDVADRPFAVTVERVDPDTAHAWRHAARGPDGLVGTLAVVVRRAGRLYKIRRVGLTPGAALAYAATAELSYVDSDDVPRRMQELRDRVAADEAESRDRRRRLREMREQIKTVLGET
jgi:hypothetical protein